MMCRLLLIAVIFMTVPVSRVSADQEPVSHVTAAELLAQIQTGTAPLIVDVRSRSEFDAGHVPGALYMPFWAVLFRSPEIPVRHGEPIVVYCAHGPRAGFAKAALRLSGYKRVLYLEGHMSAWKKAGLPQEMTPDTP
jgi:rhodanese-related sulfurtransferase